jgi:hypothetical protein
VSSVLGDGAIFEHEDLMRLTHRTKTMGNHHARAAGLIAGQLLIQFMLAFCVQTRHWFVYDEKVAIRTQESPRECYALTLTSRPEYSCLSLAVLCGNEDDLREHGVVFVGQLSNVPVGAGLFRGALDGLRIAHLGTPMVAHYVELTDRVTHSPGFTHRDSTPPSGNGGTLAAIKETAQLITR